ncbi:MAG: hypothetical protein SFU25_09490 [Candidatus Caenarcaniphilales bacterium]|nr:hypothetical protein [Candidatus Caenarcaniphilales bacterium]
MEPTTKNLFSLLICFLALLVSGLIMNQSKATEYGPNSYRDNCRRSAEVDEPQPPEEPTIIIVDELKKQLKESKIDQIVVIDGKAELKKTVLIAY